MYKVEIRKKQIFDKDGNPVTIVCNNGKAKYVPGTNTDTAWYDITQDLEALDKLDICFEDLEKKGTAKATDLTVINNSFNLIRDWIYCTPCSHLNAFDVRLTHDKCRIELDNFLIKADNLKFCEDDGCKIKITLRAENEAYRCLCNTTMYDNHQGWFDGEKLDPINRKNFPMFQVALENDAAGAKLGTALFYQSFPSITTLNAQLQIPTVRQLLIDNGIDIVDALSTRRSTLEAFGLDNFAAAPLIRELIQNLADLCGLGVDSFFDTSPYNLDCWLEVQQGRYHRADDNDFTKSSECWFFQENISFRTPKEFFDILAKRYNAEWGIENGKLFFRRNIDVLNEPEVVDFSDSAENICYEFSGDSKPACYRLEYAIEDCASNQISPLYNGLAKWDKDNNNQLLEGVETCSLEVAATGFVRDGTAPDYMRLAARQALGIALINILNLLLLVASLTAGILSAGAAIALATSAVVWVVTILAKYRQIRREFTEFYSDFTGVVRICNQQEITIPRILRWTGTNEKGAKVVYQEDPFPRTDCNTLPYREYHNLAADRGNSSNNKANTGMFRAFNYPHYFDQNFFTNAYEDHEPTKNPNNNNEGNQIVTFKSCQDCNELSALGVFKGQTAALGKYVKIKSSECFGNRVKITKIRLFEGYTYITGKLFRK